MSKELVPITDFPVAAALPEYLPAERIGVDIALVNKVAGWSCFKRDVQISAYHGEVSSYDIGVSGVANDNTAVASAAGEAEIAKRGDFAYDDLTPEMREAWLTNLVRLHAVPTLHAKLNIAEIQQRLQNQHAVLRDPKVWSRELNSGLGEALRGAARQHILKGNSCNSEALGVVLGTAGFTFFYNVYDLVLRDSVDLATNSIMGVTAALFFNNLRKIRRSNRADPTNAETCYSIVPGYHLDRYAAVYGITRARRLIQPIK